MKETKYCRTATKSRHFAVQTPPSAKTSSSITSATSSKHFLHSPSSAIGSVRSMPNLLTTLVPPHMEEMFPEESGCSCKSLAEAARSQFQHCPIFQETRRSYVQSRRNAQQKSGVSCCDEQILQLQASLRHLCPHGCYLRAFAPLREWHSLRAIVAERSETSSPDVILEGWRCSLAGVPSDDVDDKDTGRKRKLIDKPPLVQVVFVSPDGKCFKGRQRVLKTLGLVGSDITPTLLPRSLNRELYLSNTKTTLTVANTNALLFQQSGVSPFGLLEELFRNDPWRLLLSTIMLNRTTRCQVDTVLYEFLRKWPDATSASCADETEVANVIYPMGMRFRRAKGIIRFSREWLELLEKKATANNTPLSEEALSMTKQEVLGLYNCGEYAYDAFRIFVQEDLYAVTTDHALQIYVDYHRGLDKAIGR